MLKVFFGRDESEIFDVETTDSRVVEDENLTVIVIQHQRVWMLCQADSPYLLRHRHQLNQRSTFLVALRVRTEVGGVTLPRVEGEQRNG